MACKDFEIFDKYSEEELADVSSFLFQYGRALTMEMTEMNKEAWLRYHKASAPEDALKEFLPGFQMPYEDMPKHLKPDKSAVEGLEWLVARSKNKELGVLTEVAKFRLERGF